MKNLINSMVTANGMAAMQNPNARMVDPKQQDLNAVMMSMDNAWDQSKVNQIQMDQRQQMMMQQAWQQSQAVQMQEMQRVQMMDQVYQQQMEVAQAEAWKDNFIQNEVLNAKEGQLNEVKIKFRSQIVI